MENHMINLKPSPFKMIREGNKTIELCLYDEVCYNIFKKMCLRRDESMKRQADISAAMWWT